MLVLLLLSPVLMCVAAEASQSHSCYCSQKLDVTCRSHVTLWCRIEECCLCICACAAHRDLRLNAWMQASKANNASSLDRPHQSLVLHRALQGVQFASKSAQISCTQRLLSAMLHPEAEKRMTAEQMHELAWLQEAAAVPLSECPIRI